MADAITPAAKIPTEPALDKDDFEILTYQPEWLPFNDDALVLCKSVVTSNGFPDTGKLGQKHLFAVASLLYALAKVSKKNSSDRLEDESSKPTYFGVSRGAAALSLFPKVGKNILVKVLGQFIANGVLTKVDGSGNRGFWLDEGLDKWKANPTMTLYVVDCSSLDKARLLGARYIQTGKAPVRINGAEHRGERERRKKLRLAKPSLKKKDAKIAFGNDLVVAESHVEALNAFWLQHPMVLQNGHAAASATRVYHDGRMDAGGRFYGLWTGLKGTSRLQATIDDEPVCQIDIKGSQPTLLSSLLGIKLNHVSNDETWYDVYTQLTGLWDFGLDGPDVYGDDWADQLVRPRAIAKSVIMEIIGTGNVKKLGPSDRLKEETNVTQEEWNHFLERLIDAIPALKKLEPRYDSSGHLSGYINGPRFLSFHESEMILLTIEELHSRGVPAYPMHDCLILKEKDAAIGVKVLQQTVSDYCFNLSGLKVIVPLTVECSQGRKPLVDLGILPDSLRGVYPSS